MNPTHVHITKLSRKTPTSLLHSTVCIFTFLLLACLVTASAQIPPFVLKHSLLPPAAGQSGGQLGSSVAMDGAFVVAGAPLDKIAASKAAGIVKVVNSTTGTLLHVLT
ncbi:MAG: hypothetical protein ABL974_04055, partial [Prosthecobacter sp.]